MGGFDSIRFRFRRDCSTDFLLEAPSVPFVTLEIPLGEDMGCRVSPREVAFYLLFFCELMKAK